MTTVQQTPRMCTIRETAKLGILSEHHLRAMVREGSAPVIFAGKKALINVDRLVEMLNALGTPLDTSGIAYRGGGRADG